MERHVANATGFCPGEIIAAGEAAIRRRLPRRLAVKRDVALKHGQEPLTVRGVAGFDDEVEAQAAFAGGQVQLVTVVDLAAAFTMMSAWGSNRLTSLSRAGTGSPASTRRSVCAMICSTSGW